ncbi:MAG: hypothetical protein F7C07_05785 [Desulfurococcales archaeon]|nr:hypothetical protein [Desulfurococcales archaeon]
MPENSYPVWDNSRRLALALVLVLLSAFSVPLLAFEVVEPPRHFLGVYGLQGFNPLYFSPDTGLVAAANNTHLAVISGGEALIVKARTNSACQSGSSIYFSLLPPGIGREWELLEVSNGSSVTLYRVTGTVLPFSRVVCGSDPFLVSSNSIRGVTVAEFRGAYARVLEVPLPLTGLRDAAYWNGRIYLVYGSDYYVEVDLERSMAVQWRVEVPWADRITLNRVSATTTGPIAGGRAIVNGSALGLLVDLGSGRALLINWTTAISVDVAASYNGTLWAFLRPAGDWGILAEIRGQEVVSAVKIVLPASFTLTASGFGADFWMAGRLLGDLEDAGFAVYWGLSTSPGMVGEGYLVRARALPVGTDSFRVTGLEALLEPIDQRVASRDLVLPVEKKELEPTVVEASSKVYRAVIDRGVIMLTLAVLAISLSTLLYSLLKNYYW